MKDQVIIGANSAYQVTGADAQARQLSSIVLRILGLQILARNEMLVATERR